MTLSSEITWTNQSVRAFAGDRDPIQAIEEEARRIALSALDNGWSGPPYDPLQLAQIMGIEIAASDEIRDAMATKEIDRPPKVTYNPLQPSTRINFSIAHEIMHTRFPDFANAPRYRLGKKIGGDDWQLEMLCNLGASDLLMPAGDLGSIEPALINIDWVLEKRKDLRVSTEALLLRLVRLADFACAIFCASRLSDPGEEPRIRLDYLVTSRAWSTRPNAKKLKSSATIAQCTAIAFTAKGKETWPMFGEEARIECVGLPGYDGQLFPRVAGILIPVRELPRARRSFELLKGNALEPRGKRPAVIAHLVNNRTANWSPVGFAGAVKKKWPDAQRAFRLWAESGNDRLALGKCHSFELEPGLFLFTMIAQAGYGPSPIPRLKYGALQKCLSKLNNFAEVSEASIHMPMIGTGQAGGSWDLIQTLIEDELTSRSDKIFIYQLPPAKLSADRNG